MQLDLDSVEIITILKWKLYMLCVCMYIHVRSINCYLITFNAIIYECNCILLHGTDNCILYTLINVIISDTSSFYKKINKSWLHNLLTCFCRVEFVNGWYSRVGKYYGMPWIKLDFNCKRMEMQQHSHIVKKTIVVSSLAEIFVSSI